MTKQERINSLLKLAGAKTAPAFSPIYITRCFDTNPIKLYGLNVHLKLDKNEYDEITTNFKKIYIKNFKHAYLSEQIHIPLNNLTQQVYDYILGLIYKKLNNIFNK